jgi:hypothetical protein
MKKAFTEDQVHPAQMMSSMNRVVNTGGFSMGYSLVAVRIFSLFPFLFICQC